MIRIRLKALLSDRKMTQRELQEKTGIRPTTLSNIATEKIRELPIAILDRLCEALDCQPCDLLEYQRDNGSN